MLGNYLAAALRNLGRNRLHSAITTASLAIGFAAVIFAAVFWRYELGFDRFWPEHDRIYMAAAREGDGGLDTSRIFPQVPADIAAAVKAEVPGVEETARLAHQPFEVRVGEAVFKERTAYWADPALFRILRPRVLAGDVGRLAEPGTVVLNESHAAKYFGDAGPIGRALVFTSEDRKDPKSYTVEVVAVIADLPGQSHLHASAPYLSGAGAASPLTQGGRNVMTYFRVREGVRSQALATAFDTVTARRPPPAASDEITRYVPLPLTDIYMRNPDRGPGGGDDPEIRSGGMLALWAFGGLAGLILLVAAVNFVTLMTARGAGRAVEVGVRKAAGARRHDLVIQFIGEAILYATLAFAVAVVIAELALPLVGRLTGLTLQLDYIADGPLLLAVLMTALVVGGLAGVYPALALSAFRPASVLKGGVGKSPGSALLRQALLTTQFLPLVFLSLAAATFHIQSAHSVKSALSMDDPDALLIDEPCSEPVRARIAAVSGVRSVTCTEENSFTLNFAGMGEEIGDDFASRAHTKDGRETEVDPTLIDREGLVYHGVKLAAGRLWERPDERGVLLNETTARNLGYADPKTAVGQSVEWWTGQRWTRSDILGVTRDRGGFSGFERVIYYQNPGEERDLAIGVKVTDADDPQVLEAIDQAWSGGGALRQPDRSFYRDRVTAATAEANRQVGLVTLGVGVGVAVAVLGLFGLSSFLAEQRTKEIGVRKALGAGRGALMRMLLFQFTRPVLIANLIACPLLIAGVELLINSQTDVDTRLHVPPSVFAVVVLGSLLLAILATFLHAWRVTGARPVQALRYE